MKKNIHPPYQQVLFVDTATGDRFLCGSTLQTKERETYEGKEYPVYRIPISSASHPFFTGGQELVDREGRVDKFKKRYARRPASTGPKEKKEEGSLKTVKKETGAKKSAAKKTPAKKGAAKKVLGKTASNKAAGKNATEKKKK